MNSSRLSSTVAAVDPGQRFRLVLMPGSSAGASCFAAAASCSIHATEAASKMSRNLSSRVGVGGRLKRVLEHRVEAGVRIRRFRDRSIRERLSRLRQTPDRSTDSAPVAACSTARVCTARRLPSAHRSSSAADRRGALEVNVQAAAVAVSALALGPTVVALRAICERRDAGRLRRLHALARRHPASSRPLSKERLIADQLGRQAQAGIGGPAARYRDPSLCRSGRIFETLPVRGGRHDVADQLLDTPAVLDEVAMPANRAIQDGRVYRRACRSRRSF